LIAGLGSLLGGRGGASGGADEYLKMAGEIASYFSNMPFDQLAVDVVRDATRDIRLEDFTLLSPQIRMNGTGTIRFMEGVPISKQPLDLRLKLAARDRMAEHFGKAKLLAEGRDDLGYLPFADPLRVGGTLEEPDTSEFKNLLKKVAMMKAGDAILNRLLGR
jgi:hypothetical protein